MSNQKIECPKCQHEFSLTEVIAKEIEEKASKKYRESESKMAAELAKERAKLEKQNIEMEKNRAEFDLLVETKVRAQKLDLEKKIENQVMLKSRLELDDLKAQLEEKEKAVIEALGSELELRKRARELEAKEKSFDLEMERRLSEASSKIGEQVRKESDEANAMKLAEKDKLLSDMKKTIDELKRKSAQGSQQIQGEVLELEIEKLVSEKFPEDEVEEVKKGARGADISHRVMMSSGRVAGTILNECKNAMAWDSRWLPKFKNDMREKNADIGVIISKVLPEEIQDMGTIDGVWVCKPSVYPILLNILRDLIMRLKRAELAAEMPKDQKDFLFQYMTSNKFAQRIQGICEKTKSMRDSLESEKNAYDRIWKRRAIEIEQINSFVSGIYGEIEGFVGKALPKIDGLELESFGDRGSLPANINSNERA